MKLLAMAFDQDLTCLIFPLLWAHLRIKNSLKCPFPMIKSSHSGNTIYKQLLSMKDSTKIELFYFYDNFRRIAQWVLPFWVPHQKNPGYNNPFKIRADPGIVNRWGGGC